ncbi:hypothetical protein CCM_09303 [Cordyceps militaris CM01]|uniref:Uncharacterized protein n=1 Tax=Cordyceps militaris (strain CM01) TaxID=983644 RepID=G3JU13_CORMM|nr:uncharacterized protein CCM_09303 [Cordyceps militaris CM01]EGX88167.1 hypothetical protein CCM_09303 [Cordyceps militaris CM01]
MAKRAQGLMADQDDDSTSEAVVLLSLGKAARLGQDTREAIGQMQSGGTGMLDGRDVVVAVHEATGTDLAAKGAAYAEDQTSKRDRWRGVRGVTRTAEADLSFFFVMVVGENEKNRILGEWDGWVDDLGGWAEQRFGKDVPCGAAGQALTILVRIERHLDNGSMPTTAITATGYTESTKRRCKRAAIMHSAPSDCRAQTWWLRSVVSTIYHLNSPHHPNLKVIVPPVTSSTTTTTPPSTLSTVHIFIYRYAWIRTLQYIPSPSTHPMVPQLVSPSSPSLPPLSSLPSLQLANKPAHDEQIPMRKAERPSRLPGLHLGCQ